MIPRPHTLDSSPEVVLHQIGLHQTLFWFERRFALGVERKVSKALKNDLVGGYAFDRQFFETRNFSEKKRFLINADNAYFIGLNLRYSF